MTGLAGLVVVLLFLAAVIDPPRRRRQRRITEPLSHITRKRRTDERPYDWRIDD